MPPLELRLTSHTPLAALQEASIAIAAHHFAKQAANTTPAAASAKTPRARSPRRSPPALPRPVPRTAIAPHAGATTRR
jgi:hypothetical protein